MRCLIANRDRLFFVVAFVAAASFGSQAAKAQSLAFINSWTGNSTNGFLSGPDTVAVGPFGNVYVTDRNNNRVQIFNASGVFAGSFGTSGSGNGQFSAPEGIAVDSAGNIYVADTNNNRVEIFNPSGTFQSSFGSSGTANGQFSFPDGISLASSGNIYVTDRNNNRVQIFNSAGVFQNTFGSGGSITGRFNLPNESAVSPTGLLYVADTGNNRIQIFSPSTFFQGSFGSFGSGNGQLSGPFGVAVGPTGTVYVSDTSNGRIEIFDSSGIFQSSFGTFGSGNGQFNSPEGIAVAPTGMVYVVDRSTNRVERLFDPSSWISGTNTFVDSTTGPTSVVVGSGQLLGTSLTLNSGMGLEVGGSVTVNSGGVLAMNGGSLTAPSGIIVNTGGSFNYQSGSIDIGSITIHGGIFQAINGGQLLNLGAVSLGTDPSAEILLDGGITLTAQSVLVQSGLLALGNAAISVTGNSFLHITAGEVQLQIADQSVINTSEVEVDGGLLDGSGRINAKLQNNVAGEVSVAIGQVMTLTAAANINNGLMSLTGGTFHFTQDLTNNPGAAIEGYGTLRVDGGLTNKGALSVGGGQPASLFGAITNTSSFNLAGSSFVFGIVNNQSGGVIRLSGNTPNIFYSAVTNSGAINIDTGAIGIFYGGVTGAGTLTNAGTAQFAANSSVGSVSGVGSTSLASAVTLNANSFSQAGLTLQLAGNTAGANSKLIVTGALNLSGTLTVDLVNGFTPALGSSFDLMDWGTLSGHFSSFDLPTLSTGLAWSTNQLYTTGVLSVIDGNFIPGDTNRDGKVSAADIAALMGALSNLSGYKSAHNNLTNPQLLEIADLNGDGQVTNADIQSLINLVANNTSAGIGGGTIAAVPEPATIWLLIMGLSAAAVVRPRR